MGQLQIKGKITDRIYIPVKYVSPLGRERKVDALIDTGAIISYIGISHIEGLKCNVDLEKITLKNLIGMYGIVGVSPSRAGKQPRPKPNEKIYASLPVKIKSIVLGDITVDSPQINIPLSFYLSEEGKTKNIQFERKDFALIGTDILRNFNYGININSLPVFMITRPSRVIPPRDISIKHLDFED